MPDFDVTPERRRRRKRRLLVLGAVGVVTVGVALLLWPLVRAPFEARAAADDLTAAKQALAAGDEAQAQELVASARDHVDDAQGGITGIASDAAGIVPGAGSAVDDGRHLVTALDEATSVAEIAIELYPATASDQATLLRDEQVDEAVLDRVLTGVRTATERLTSAQAELDEVRGTTPLVGGTITAKRDEAAALLDPMVETLTGIAPALDRLPAVLGFEGERTYLLALLNPAELRYSGGASLSFAPVTVDQGKIEFGDSVNTTSDPSLIEDTSWRAVSRNPYHRPGSHPPTSATFAPSWSVSGEELLRAWRATRGERYDGVIAVDVVALARLLGVSGGITIPGFGEVNGDNLTQVVSGSYDQYYPDPTVKNDLNDQLIPAFESSFLNGGNFVDKARVLAEAADGRHFALYLRDRDVEEALSAVGVDGDLTEPSGDYIAAFTQNTNGSKVDYFQRRSVALDVQLAADGSATDSVKVTVHNDSPPYAVPGTDPKSWYFTRWAGLALGVFVPRDAELQDASLLGEPSDVQLRRFYKHAVAASPMMLPQGATGEFSMRYSVPDAATVDESGELTYRLSYDPQGMVIPPTGSVTVRLPAGYVATSVPEGWSIDGDSIILPAQELSTRQQWEIVAVTGQ